jgi:hypothetical protein
VVPCGDHEAMSTALVEILRDPAKRNRYGAASLARVADFTVDAMVDRTLAAYTGAIPDALPSPLSQPREEARASTSETPDLDECEAIAS